MKNKQIEKFLKYIEKQKNESSHNAFESSSSWYEAYNEAMQKVYNKARKIFVEKKK